MVEWGKTLTAAILFLTGRESKGEVGIGA